MVFIYIPAQQEIGKKYTYINRFLKRFKLILVKNE